MKYRNLEGRGDVNLLNCGFPLRIHQIQFLTVR